MAGFLLRLGKSPTVAHPGRDEQLWYYRFLVHAFRGHPSRMAGRLRRIDAEIEMVTSAG